MIKWLIENKDLFIPFATLLCAAFGGWWAGKKRVGIEVLSKNRQEWINDLRRQVSEFTSISAKMPLDIAYKQMYSTYGMKDKYEIFEKINKLAVIRDYILLLLNPSEENSKEINKSISEILDIISEIHNKDTNILTEEEVKHISKNFSSKIALLTKNTQIVLKIEWERVKKGI